jgi:phosphoribosyl-AMP cyclohydrolase
MIQLDFKKNGGLIPAIVQDEATGEILMLAYMNQQAFEATLSTGKATYYSRSRKTLWVKGETSGNIQLVKEIRIDCDNDTILLKVEQLGRAACHTGHRSCFYKKVENGSIRITGEPLFDPKEVYNK